MSTIFNFGRCKSPVELAPRSTRNLTKKPSTPKVTNKASLITPPLLLQIQIGRFFFRVKGKNCCKTALYKVPLRFETTIGARFNNFHEWLGLFYKSLSRIQDDHFTWFLSSIDKQVRFAFCIDHTIFIWNQLTTFFTLTSKWILHSMLSSSSFQTGLNGEFYVAKRFGGIETQCDTLFWCTHIYFVDFFSHIFLLPRWIKTNVWFPWLWVVIKLVAY